MSPPIDTGAEMHYHLGCKPIMSCNAPALDEDLGAARSVRVSAGQVKPRCEDAWPVFHVNRRVSLAWTLPYPLHHKEKLPCWPNNVLCRKACAPRVSRP